MKQEKGRAMGGKGKEGKREKEGVIEGKKRTVAWKECNMKVVLSKRRKGQYGWEGKGGKN